MRSPRKWLVWVVGIFCLCLGPSVVLLPSQEPPALTFHLRDITSNAGIQFRHDNAASSDMFLLETIGGGCAWLDYDRDGWLDLFLVQSSPTPSYQPSEPLRNALYRNQRDGTFVNVGQKVGLGDITSTFGMGAAVGDFDNDGDPDLYVTGFPRSLFYRNDDGRFVDITESAGVTNAGQWGTSAGFFDYDNDGWLDLIVVNYMAWGYEKNFGCGLPKPGYRTYCHPDMFAGVPPTLYHNNGDGTFTDLTRAAGLDTFEGKGLGVVMADYDNDGWMDIFQANDAVRNFLFRNNGDGTFTDVSFEAGVAYGEDGDAEAGMGTDFGDYDRDGFLDIFVTHLDMELHRLFRNSKEGFFTDYTRASHLARRTNFLSGFGTKFVDIDNDGWLDILQINGHILPNINLYNSHVEYAEPKILWLNQGNGTFRNVSEQLGPDFLRPAVGRGLCLADLDNDGDVDFAVANNGEPAQLWLNEGGNRHNWLALTLIGTKSNRDAVGARVTVVADAISQTQQKLGGGSYLSASDPRLYFGLGKAPRVSLLRVVWPSGVVDELKDVPVNQLLVLREGDGHASLPEQPEAAKEH